MTTDLKFLVIGSNSFSGASFINTVLAKGYPVLGVSRSPEPAKAFLPYKWHSYNNKFQFHQLDINSNIDEISALIEKERPAYIINFAAQSMVAESWINPDHWFMTNVVSTVRLHEKIRKMNFIQRYLHISTPEVYGSTSGNITEDAPFNPSTPYAVSRAAADMSLMTYYKTYNFPVCLTRAANVFGEGQQLYRIIPRTILFIRTGRKLQLHGGGVSERSFIHIDDVSEATYAIATKGNIGECYHISTERIISIRSLVEQICEELRVDFNEVVEFVGERVGKDAAYKLDSSKLRKQLNWSDKISLEDGIKRSIDWVDNNLKDLSQHPLSYIHKA